MRVSCSVALRAHIVRSAVREERHGCAHVVGRREGGRIVERLKEQGRALRRALPDEKQEPDHRSHHHCFWATGRRMVPCRWGAPILDLKIADFRITDES